MEAFTFIPIFFGVIFVIVISGMLLVFGGIIFVIVKGIGTWAWNNEQPIQTVAARVVAKRTSTSGGGATMDSGGSVSTSYYATFEMESGERQELGVAGREYGLLVEGDTGTLTFQGTRYKGFARSR